jgi:hypothetical protein
VLDYLPVILVIGVFHDHLCKMLEFAPYGDGNGEVIRMEEQSAFNVARLREKAAHCRKMAVDARSYGVARELESIAREYEDGALKLELGSA